MTNNWKPDFTINPALDTEKVAELVKQCLDYWVSEEDSPHHDLLNDSLYELHDHVFPGASRVLTLEESQARELSQIDRLLMGAIECVSDHGQAKALIVEARTALDHYAARNDLPSIN